MDERWFDEVKRAVYRLVGSLSVEELTGNHELVASFERLERLIKTATFTLSA